MLLRQVDDCVVQTNDEEIAKEIFNIIWKKLQFENEDEWQTIMSATSTSARM